MILLVFFSFGKNQMDKEIQCEGPCWDNKAVDSDVFKNELLMFFMLDSLCSFPDAESQLL